MLTVTSRRALGFRDDFEGYVFLKDGKYPVAQYHLYKDYNTFFWLGNADLEGLVQCLGEAIEEISRRQNERFESLNKGMAQYVSQGVTHFGDFMIDHGYDHMNMYLTPRYREDDYFRAIREDRNSYIPVSFARYDVESSLALPIILWADLGQNPEAEIGFSTTLQFPFSVLKYFQKTCRVNITNAELEDVLGHITDAVGDPVLV